MLKENTTKGENIGISKITLKKDQPIKELKFSKYFKILDLIEKINNEHVCLVRVSIPPQFSKLLKWMDLEILWDRPMLISKDYVVFSCLGSESSLQKVLKFSKMLGNVTAVSYCDADYGNHKILADLTPKEKYVLFKAIKCGYYEYPRKINATALADDIKVSKSTVVEHLRKAENKLISWVVFRNSLSMEDYD